jgi:hypothetical protein
MEITPIQEEVLILVLQEKLPEISRLSSKQIISKIGREKLSDGERMIFSYLEGTCGPNLTKHEMFALLSRVFRCLTGYLHSVQGLPVTLHSIFNNIHFLPHAVDLAFPGYADAGLLKAIITPRSLARSKFASDQMEKAS